MLMRDKYAGPSARHLRSVGLSLGLKDGAGAFCCACRVLAAAMRHRHDNLRRAFAILAASLRALLATLVAWEQAAWSDRRRTSTAAASDSSRPTLSPSGESDLRLSSLIGLCPQHVSPHTFCWPRTVSRHRVYLL